MINIPLPLVYSNYLCYRQQHDYILIKFVFYFYVNILHEMLYTPSASSLLSKECYYPQCFYTVPKGPLSHITTESFHLIYNTNIHPTWHLQHTPVALQHINMSNAHHSHCFKANYTMKCCTCLNSDIQMEKSDKLLLLHFSVRISLKNTLSKDSFLLTVSIQF